MKPPMKPPMKPMNPAKVIDEEDSDNCSEEDDYFDPDPRNKPMPIFNKP